MRRRAPALMLQGTASSVGKSYLAAGLCRLYARRGVRVAPFKAQNMALNAAVTPDGCEIGRGGVFASLLGTLDLLRPAERARIKGLVVNRFRGDPSLFTDGVRLLERRSGLPVLGVVPSLPVRLPAEDSLDLPRLSAPRAG